PRAVPRVAHRPLGDAAPLRGRRGGRGGGRARSPRRGLLVEALTRPDIGRNPQPKTSGLPDGPMEAARHPLVMTPPSCHLLSSVGLEEPCPGEQCPFWDKEACI